MCGAHAAVRSLLGEIVAGDERETIVDIEAGLEHLSRGTARHVDAILLVLEPYFKSMETAARMNDLALELGIPRVCGVANKVRSADDETALRDFSAARGLTIVATIPDDEAIARADRAGIAPLDYDESSPAVAAIRALAGTLSPS